MSYFRRVAAAHPNRLWVNNPTLAECDLALAAGAVSCTSNPTFAASLLRRERADALAIVDACLEKGALAADEVQQRMIARVCARFLPRFEASGGREGFVSIQGDPHRDTDADHMIDEALRFRRIAPNVIAKIPVTAAGLVAIEAVLREGMPVIATEVFAVAQAVAMADVYARIPARGGRKPALWLTHITGIFDEWLAQQASARGLALAPEDLAQAGWLVARTQYRLLQTRGFDGVLLGGGARAPRHFTDLIGGRFDVTLNWPTIAELVRSDPPVQDRLSLPPDPAAVARLSAALPEFAAAIHADGLRREEFEHFAPVRHFLAMFIAGWEELQAAIGERRRAQAAHAG